MKILHLLLILLLVSGYKMCGGIPSKAEYCNIQAVSENEYRCCFEHYIYLTGKLKIEHEVKQCISLTKIDYDAIKSYEKYRKEIIEKTLGDIDDYEINCSSKYFNDTIKIIMNLLLLWLNI